MIDWSDLLFRASTVQVRLTALQAAGLAAFGSKRFTKETSDVDKRQMVIDELTLDPARNKGPRRIKEGMERKGINLTRYLFIRCELVSLLLTPHLFR